MPFTMDNWTIAGEWIEPMQRVNCLGTTFYAHLMDSMSKLVSAIGEPLRHQANLLTNANAPVADYVFTGDDMAKYLRDGNFKYGTTPGDILVIHGPDEELLIKDSNARAPINGHTMRLNFYKYVNMVHENYSNWFPENDVGLGNLKTLLGKVVLHEMLHNEGFSHPNRSDFGNYNASDVYWRTFPEVAEEAYNRLRGGLPSGAFQLLPDGTAAHCLC